MRNNKTQNWLKQAVNQVPKGELQNKLDAIAEACSISLPTVYRWISKGNVPRLCDKHKINEILNINE